MKASLDDGTVFDSSAGRRARSRSLAGQVFPGFAEALGDAGRRPLPLHHPAELGVRRRAAPPAGRPARATSTFDVQVVKIVRGSAAMMQQARRSSSRSNSSQASADDLSGGSALPSAACSLAEVDQHHLQRRQDRVGEQHAEDAEQRAHQQLHRRAPAPARGRPCAGRCTARPDSHRCSARRNRRRSHRAPWCGPALNPTATISTPDVIAPMLGMKASTPVTRPSSAAIGTPPMRQHEPGEERLRTPCRRGARTAAGEA